VLENRCKESVESCTARAELIMTNKLASTRLNKCIIVVLVLLFSVPTAFTDQRSFSAQKKSSLATASTLPAFMNT
jgi:hypothetical protein